MYKFRAEGSGLQNMFALFTLVSITSSSTTDTEDNPVNPQALYLFAIPKF